MITRLSNIRCRNGDFICRQLFALCNYTMFLRGGRYGRDRMVIGFTCRGVFDTIICDKVCQWLAAGQ